MSVVFPPPDLPTSATFSPGLIIKLIPSRILCLLFWYLNVKSDIFICPFARLINFEPRSISEGSSINPNTLLAAAIAI